MQYCTIATKMNEGGRKGGGSIKTDGRDDGLGAGRAEVGRHRHGEGQLTRRSCGDKAELSLPRNPRFRLRSGSGYMLAAII